MANPVRPKRVKGVPTHPRLGPTQVMTITRTVRPEGPNWFRERFQIQHGLPGLVSRRCDEAAETPQTPKRGTDWLQLVTMELKAPQNTEIRDAGKGCSEVGVEHHGPDHTGIVGLILNHLEIRSETIPKGAARMVTANTRSRSTEATEATESTSISTAPLPRSEDYRKEDQRHAPHLHAEACPQPYRCETKDGFGSSRNPWRAPCPPNHPI